MKIFFHNFDPNSNSGPNKFTRQLFQSMVKSKKVSFSNSQDNCDVEFSLIQLTKEKKKPMILRLDGIYFNLSQDYRNQNAPIKYSYDAADAVIFQSEFNKNLTEFYFGPHKNSSIVHNYPDTEAIDNISTDFVDKIIDKSIDVWSCASSWRPHKRLEDNLRYFNEKSYKNSVMLVAGKNADISVIKKYNSITKGRIYYLGDLSYEDLVSVYKRSSTFVHLSYLDHCPNVVVDAQAAGAKIICSSSGGTKEIVKNGEVIIEPEWDFRPIKLYEPPTLDFDNYIIKSSMEKTKNIHDASKMYFEKMRSIIQ